MTVVDSVTTAVCRMPGLALDGRQRLVGVALTASSQPQNFACTQMLGNL